MPESDPASARQSLSSARSRRVVAWACSIVVHLLAIHAASRAVLVVDETETAPMPSVVWLEVRPVVQTEPEPEPAPEPQPEPETEEDAEPQTEPEPRSATEATAPTEDVEAETAPPEAETGESRTSRNYIVREVDWDEERRRAVEQVSEQLAREQNYPTFSLDDVTEEAAPEEPGPTGDIFAASPRGGGRSLLTPGRSGGPIGRRVTALCDVLGGIGLGFAGWSLGSICAEPGPRYTFFAQIKPDYLRARPVCTEVPGAEAPSSSAPGDPTVKCRLVMEDELAAPQDLVTGSLIVREGSRPASTGGAGASTPGAVASAGGSVAAPQVDPVPTIEPTTDPF